MDPELTPEQAAYELHQIRRILREQGAGLEEAEAFAQSQGFGSYRDFVYYAQNGVLPDEDPDQARAEVGRMGPFGRFRSAVVGGTPFTDELTGLLSGGTPGPVDDYLASTAPGAPSPSRIPEEGAADRMNTRRDVLREDYPGATFAAEMIPGMAIPVGGAAGVSGRLASRGASRIGTSAGGAAAGGALEGALYGAGEGEGLRERGTNAVIGTGIGATTGGLFGSVLGLGGAGVARLMRGLSERAAEGQGVNRAGQWFRRFFDENPGWTPDRMDEVIGQYGDEAIVADAIPSPGGRGIFAARSVAGGQLDVPGGPVQRLSGRGLERGERLNRDLMFVTNEMGIPVEGKVDEAVDLLKAKAQTDYYGPLDERFGEFVLDEVPEMMDLFRRNPQIAQNAQAVIGDIERPLRFADFQRVRNAMRDRLRRMEGDPQAPIGAEETLQRNIAELTEAMQRGFGDEVREADALWSQAAAQADAYEIGLKLGANNSPLNVRRALQREYGKLPEEEKMAMLAGVIDRLGQKIIDSPTGGSAGSKIVNESQGMREWLTEVLGEDAYRSLQGALQREQAFNTTGQMSGANSLTPMRQADIESMREVTMDVPTNHFDLRRALGRWLSDSRALERAKGRAVGEALLAGDTGPMRELLGPRGLGAPNRLFSSSGQQEGILAAALQSPVNQWLLGHFMSQEGQGAGGGSF